MSGKRNNVDVWPDWDVSGKWVLKMQKKRGKFTLEEITRLAKEYEYDFYGLVIKAFDEGEPQYDEVQTGDYVELFRITDFLQREVPY